MKKSIWAGLLMVVLLSGCASGVRLEDVPVEDKSATSSGANSQGLGAGQNGVAGVMTNKSGDGVGPAGVGTVVYFDYDSSSVKAEFNPALQAHARYLAANPKSRVRIEGNADERGPAGYNNVLGLKRADHVRQSIVEFGASEKQVVVKSLGERKPKLNGHDEESWAENRRADIIYEREE